MTNKADMQFGLAQLAALQCATLLTNHQEALQYPQYAALGLLRRYGGLQAAGIQETEGIDHVPQKAAAFRFGQRCARLMRIQGLAEDAATEAAVAVGMLFDKPLQAGDKEQIKLLLRALIRRAQLQTHTFKPGYEDINAWLERFSAYEQCFDARLDALVQGMIRLQGSQEALRIFNPEDELIALALRREALGNRRAEDLAGNSQFARLLRVLCSQQVLPPLHRTKEYRLHPDFRPFKPVTDEQMEAIIRSKMVDVSDISGPIIITSIRMVLRGNTCFVITTTDVGIEGISICGGNWAYFYPILQKKIAPLLIGTDARQLEDNLEKIYVRDLNYKIQGLAYWCCVSWIEMSVLDILGKAAGKPVGQLFGPRCNEYVDYYIASGNRGTTPMEEIEILAARVAEIGAKAVKFKIGGRMSWDADSMDGRSEHLIEMARRYFGDDMVIHADGNGSFRPQRAIEYGHMLQDINAYFYEEPCPFDYLWETKEVADALTIPIAFGEQETSLRRFQWLIVNHAAHVLQADVQYGGGFIRTAKVARMADLAGLTITPHLSGGIQYAYVLMLASFTPNMGRYQELKVGYEETKDFFTTPLILKDGRLNIPEGPGLGMAFDKAYFDRVDTVFLVDKP